MPLQFDLTREELDTYSGSSPKPRDFDAFWERAIAELDGTEPDVELVPAEFQSEYATCHHLYFTGVRGARIHAKLLRPRRGASDGGGEGRPAVVMFHGYSIDSGDWVDKLPYVAAGTVVAALDVRGQGGLSQDVGGQTGTTLNGHIVRGLEGPPDDMLFRHVFLDTVQLVRIVMGLPEVDDARVGVTGASQGGALTLACAALEPRISRAAAVYPFLSDYRRVWEMDKDQDAYAELRSYFRRHDPTHEREEAIFEQLGYIDIQNLAPRIEADVLMGVGLMDEICPPSTQFAAFNKIPSNKRIVEYPDFAHERLPGMADTIFSFLTEE